MKVFSIINIKDPMEQVDVLLESNINFDKAYKKRDNIKAGNIKLPLIAINDLIKLKEIASRERDSIDIKALRKIKAIKNEKKKKS